MRPAIGQAEGEEQEKHRRNVAYDRNPKGFADKQDIGGLSGKDQSREDGDNLLEFVRQSQTRADEPGCKGCNANCDQRRSPNYVGAGQKTVRDAAEQSRDASRGKQNNKGRLDAGGARSAEPSSEQGTFNRQGKIGQGDRWFEERHYEGKVKRAPSGAA